MVWALFICVKYVKLIYSSIQTVFFFTQKVEIWIYVPKRNKDNNFEVLQTILCGGKHIAAARAAVAAAAGIQTLWF